MHVCFNAIRSLNVTYVMALSHLGYFLDVSLLALGYIFAFLSTAIQVILARLVWDISTRQTTSSTVQPSTWTVFGLWCLSRHGIVTKRKRMSLLWLMLSEQWVDVSYLAWLVVSFKKSIASSWECWSCEVTNLQCVEM